MKSYDKNDGELYDKFYNSLDVQEKKEFEHSEKGILTHHERKMLLDKNIQGVILTNYFRKTGKIDVLPQIVRDLFGCRHIRYFVTNVNNRLVKILREF